jgi:hypothetical protein
MVPDDPDRQALGYAHAELAARITGRGWGSGGEQPPRMTVVVPECSPALADPACREQLGDLVLLGRAENIVVVLGGVP